jgi:hypothetical protein
LKRLRKIWGHGMWGEKTVGLCSASKNHLKII